MPTATIRYDERVRDEAMPLLDAMGLSLNSYLNMALHQLVIQRRVPFDIVAGGRPPVLAVPGSKPVVRREGWRFVVPAEWRDENGDE